MDEYFPDLEQRTEKRAVTNGNHIPVKNMVSAEWSDSAETFAKGGDIMRFGGNLSLSPST